MLMFVFEDDYKFHQFILQSTSVLLRAVGFKRIRSFVHKVVTFDTEYFLNFITSLRLEVFKWLCRCSPDTVMQQNNDHLTVFVWVCVCSLLLARCFHCAACLHVFRFPFCALLFFRMSLNCFLVDCSCHDNQSACQLNFFFIHSVDCTLPLHFSLGGFK